MCFKGLLQKVIVCSASMLLALGMSVAGYGATPAGTVIQTEVLSLQYSDGLSLTVNEVSTVAWSTTVQAFHGIEVTPEVSVTASLAMGETAYFHQVLTNKGNDADTFTYTLEGLTGGWSAVVYLDSDNNGVHGAEEMTLVTSPIALAAEASSSVFVALTAPVTYITPGMVRFGIFTSGTPVGTYVGYNGIEYGGAASGGVTENAQLSDTILPVIVPLVPTQGAQGIPVDILVGIDVTDLESGVSLDTLLVSINGSVCAPTASVPITGGYRVSIDPGGLPYATTVNVMVSVSDIAGNVRSVSYDFKTRARSTAVDLTAYLHGYMNTSTRVHRAATINVQLRPTRNIDAGASINVALNASGNTGVVGIDTVPGDYYLVIRQVLSGAPLGVNHVAYVSSESITILSEQVTTINVTTENSSYYARPFVPKSGYSPLLPENGMLLIKGGEATGERVINVTDIIRWNNAATNSNADTRGKAAWSEDPNFDGDPYMNTDDFSVWNRNKGQSVPLPEEE